jgi:endoglucanase
MTPSRLLRTLSLAVTLAVPSSLAQPEVHLNQTGFYPSAPKVAVVTAPGAERFYVVSASGADTVFAGPLGAPRLWEHAAETVRLADFSALRQPGTYRLVLEDGTVSHPFRIAEGVHREVAQAALKAFYFQRVGIDLTLDLAGPWARPAGHVEEDRNVRVHVSAATDQRPEGTVIQSPYGWYDAGDYNKYVVNSGISTYQLLALYEHFPALARRFEVGIPETGGPLPDVLAEAWWNIRWMRTMQDPHDGSVYHKLTNPSFDDVVMPHEANEPRYVVQKSTAATLNFAAVMAQASRVFRPYDAALADSMSAAAVRAWEWAQQHPTVLYNQDAMNRRFDPDIVTGAYGDGDLSDEFAWAAVELYVTTGEELFLEEAGDHVGTWSVPHWGDVRALGYYTLLYHRDRVGPAAEIERVEAELFAMADALRQSHRDSAYGVVMGVDAGDFVWGSNAVTANQSMALLQAYRLTEDATYLHAALSNLDYLLGRNPTGFSFVTGYGSRTPMHPHHRPSEADGVEDPVPGMLAGGPNPRQQDAEYCATYGEAGAYPSDLPALSYLDHWCSYASNEIAINWNAPLVYVAAALEALMAEQTGPSTE